MPHPNRIAILIAAWLVATTGLRAELRLEADLHGRTTPVTDVEPHAIFIGTGAQRKPLPADARFVIKGDLRTNAADVFWSPNYSVWRIDAPDQERNHLTKPYLAADSLWHSGTRASEEQPDALFRCWPGGVNGPAIVVLAWVVDGRVTHVRAHAVPAMMPSRDFDLTDSFPISAPEARGEMVVLLWSGGRFIPPTPRFAAPTAEAAFHAVEFDDGVGLRSALAAGVKADAQDRDGVSLLQYAAEAGSLPCIDALLSAGAAVNTHGAGGTPLSWAAADGRVAVVKRLLAAKAQPDLDGISALQSAISGRHEAIALALIHAGAVRDARNARGRLLASALDAGMARTVAALQSRGAYLDFREKQFTAVLTTQAKLGHTAVVRLLLANHVRQNHADALIAGAISGDPDMAKALIAAGARPDDRGPDGLTALMAAAGHSHARYAQALLAAGADPNLATTSGATALDIAASSDAATVVRVLLQHGAKLGLRVGHSTALDIALAVEGRRAAAVLADAGARVDLHSKLANPELEEAVIYDLAPLISAAIADGWSPKTKFYGWPALDLAEVYHSVRCVTVLKRAGARLDTTAPRLGNPRQFDRGVRPVRLFRPEDPRLKEDRFPEARVVVELLVDRDGSARFVRLIKTDDFALVRPTIDAVSQWRFQPATVHGRPVPTLVQLPLLFPSSDSLWPAAADADVFPQLIKMVQPVYPSDLRSEGLTGTVHLQFVVNTAGRPERIQVVSAADPAFAQSAVQALSQWRFKPALRDGKPIATRMAFPMVFTLQAK